MGFSGLLMLLLPKLMLLLLVLLPFRFRFAEAEAVECEISAGFWAFCFVLFVDTAGEGVVSFAGAFLAGVLETAIFAGEENAAADVVGCGGKTEEFCFWVGFGCIGLLAGIEVREELAASFVAEGADFTLVA